jgi:hypothetical protein
MVEMQVELPVQKPVVIIPGKGHGSTSKIIQHWTGLDGNKRSGVFNDDSKRDYTVMIGYRIMEKTDQERCAAGNGDGGGQKLNLVIDTVSFREWQPVERQWITFLKSNVIRGIIKFADQNGYDIATTIPFGKKLLNSEGKFDDVSLMLRLIEREIKHSKINDMHIFLRREVEQ